MIPDSILREILLAAKTATPGPWKVVPIKGYTEDYIVTEHPDWQGPMHTNYIGETGLAAGQGTRPQKFQHDSAYIALCDPNTIAELVEELIIYRGLIETT